MADFDNIANNTIVSGTAEADYINNKGSNVEIQGGNGNDTVWNEIANTEHSGSFATIYGGVGDDSIISDSPNSVLDGGDGNDSIITWGEVTVLGGKGDDVLTLRDDNDFDKHKNLVVYNYGDGNDTVYSFNSDGYNSLGKRLEDTLQIVGASYSSVTSGNDIIVTVGEGTDSVGTITLVNAAGNTINITGGTTDTTEGGGTGGPSINTDNATDYVFILDYSNSMDNYMDRVVDISANFAQQLTNSGVDYRLGVVEYRDEDEVQAYDFTNDVNVFNENILTVKNKVGGSDEYGLTAIETALAMDYREGASKHFVVLTDAGYQEDSSMSETTIANLNANSVKLDVIGMPYDKGTWTDQYECQPEWEPIATVTGGAFYDINGDYNSIFTSIGGGGAPHMQLSRWSYNYNFPDSTSDNSSNLILASAT